MKSGDEQRCPRCGEWHRLEQRNVEGTEYERKMLYVTCRGGLYYAGNVGTAPRYPVRMKEN